MELTVEQLIGLLSGLSDEKKQWKVCYHDFEWGATNITGIEEYSMWHGPKLGNEMVITVN